MSSRGYDRASSRGYDRDDRDRDRDGGGYSRSSRERGGRDRDSGGGYRGRGDDHHRDGGRRGGDDHYDRRRGGGDDHHRDRDYRGGGRGDDHHRGGSSRGGGDDHPPPRDRDYRGRGDDHHRPRGGGDDHHHRGGGDHHGRGRDRDRDHDYRDRDRDRGRDRDRDGGYERASSGGYDRGGGGDRDYRGRDTSRGRDRDGGGYHAHRDRDRELQPENGRRDERDRDRDRDRDRGYGGGGYDRDGGDGRGGGYDRERSGGSDYRGDRGGGDRGGGDRSYGGGGGGGGGYENGNRGGGGGGYKENGRGSYDNRSGGGGGYGGGRDDRGGGGYGGGRDDRGGGGYGGGRCGGRGGYDNGRGGYDGGRGGYDGGRGGYDGGRGGYDGGGRFGRGGGRFGGRGGRGRGRSNHVVENPTSSVSNLILADITPNFRFYLYSVNAADRSGRMIDTRRRRQELFLQGLFDPEKGVFARHADALSEKDLESVRRGIFFEGSYCFTSRPIPGLERERLPLYLVANEDVVARDGCDCPLSDDGDTLQVVKVDAYDAPEILRESSAVRAQDLPGADSPITAVLEGRCGDCLNSFRTNAALLSHCAQTGHTPQTAVNEGVRSSNKEVFLSFCNVALQRAMGERMARWGREYIDPNSYQEPEDRNRNKLGVKVFRAYTCEFGLHRPDVGEKAGKLSLTLTVDLRAKILRTKSVLDSLCEGRDPHTVTLDAAKQQRALDQWRNEVVICVYDKKCYSVIDVLFDKTPESMPVEGLGISHAEYFEKKKGIKLKYPNVRPVFAVLGRNKSTIYLPPELICGNELEPRLKMQLPNIVSFRPQERHDAIEEMKRFLKPGAQKTKGLGGGLLPALGIVLGDDRMTVPVEVLPLPTITAAGVRIPPHRGNMWAPCLARANFNVEHGKRVRLNVIVVYHQSLAHTFEDVYNRLRDLVNRFNALYCFDERPWACVQAGDMEKHWGKVEEWFRRNPNLPDNIFVLDFSKPPNRQSSDPAYSVVKQMLGTAGHLSQFVNFNTYDHGTPNTPQEVKKSSIILQGVARQVLSKCGVRIWWVRVPRSLPLPAVFVGVDVFHAPRKYDPKEKRRTAKESCAAVVVQVVRDYEEGENAMSTVEIYSETARRAAGQEMELGRVIESTVRNALKHLQVSNPACCVVWRDGVGDATISIAAEQEIPDIRRAFSSTEGGDDVSLAYVVCQKRIATKFLSEDGSQGMPVGTLVTALQGAENETFYINGTSPPYSTAKPVRYVVAKRDEKLDSMNLSELSWALCHDYPNWTGPVKLPAPVQMAHKLAELAGGFVDCGDSMNAQKFTNKIHFL